MRERKRLMAYLIIKKNHQDRDGHRHKSTVEEPLSQPFELRLKGLARLSPWKEGERPIQEESSVSLSGLSHQTTFIEKQYELHFGFWNLISLKIEGGAYGECV